LIVLNTNVTIGCESCPSGRDKIDSFPLSKLSGRNIYSCPKCNAALVERSGRVYQILKPCVVYEMPVTAVSDPDLKLLMLRIVKHLDAAQHSTAFLSQIIQEALEDLAFPEKLKPEWFQSRELLDESKRRRTRQGPRKSKSVPRITE
jgi:hypothetical protein